MRIFVTGGTGFTGSHLVRRLLAQGHQVVALDNQPGRLYDELKALGAELHIGSVADRELVDRLTAGCEVVHHLAAAFRQVNLPKSVYWNVNVEGTRYMLEAALKHGVRKFVYCSTCGVHGNVENPPGDETAPIAPADYYQSTKYDGEQVVPEYVKRGLNVVILRPSAIYGPGDPDRFAMLFKRVKKGRFLMCGDGQSLYHPVYVENLVDAFLLAAESDRGNGEAYLIADEKYQTLNELVTAIGEALNVKLKIIHIPYWPVWLVALVVEMVYKLLPGIDPPIFRRRVNWFKQNRAFSVAKAAAEIGYVPMVGIAEGLRKTGEWYIQNGII